MALRVGDKAPDFTLTSFTPSEEPVEITLSKVLKDKNAVLLFFPQVFTGVCTAEACSIRDQFGEFSDGNTEVLGISVDGTFPQRAFAKENNIKFPMLSDFGRDVIKNYDVVRENFAHGMKNVASRSVYVIGKDGLIKYVEVTENPGVQINFEKLKEAIKNTK